MYILLDVKLFNMYSLCFVKLFLTKMFNCLKMDNVLVSISYYVSGDFTLRLFHISLSYKCTCLILKIKMNSNNDFKCNGCNEMRKLNETFGLHSCMGILCASCIMIESCQKCGIPFEQDHRVVVHNHDKTCKFCDSSAKWKCACHVGEFCNSCLILIHGDGFKDKLIRKYPETFNHDVMCENCKLIPAEFIISSDKQICFVCLPKQDTMMDFRRIEREKADGTRLANLIRNMSQESFIEKIEKSIKVIIENDVNTAEKLTMYMAMLKENHRKNELMIASIKPGIDFMKMLNQYPPQLDSLLTSIVNNQIDLSFFKKIFEPFIMNKELGLCNTSVEYKESQEILIDTSFHDDHQTCTQSQITMLEHEESPPTKKPRHEERGDAHEFDTNDSINSETNLDIGMEPSCTWNLVTFKDTESYTVKLVYYRCPLYLICITPGLEGIRADLLKDIKSLKEFTKKNDPHQDDIVIIKDNPKYGEQYKRGKILRKEGNTFVIKQIDHGPVLHFTRNEIYECPSVLINVPDTTFRVSLIGIAPKSRFAFLSSSIGDGAKDFIKNNLILKSKMINIKRKYVTTDSTFCNITTVIHGQEIDWTEELLKANLGDRWTENNGCFLPQFDYCYMFHVFDKCTMHDKCYRSHVCPFCSSVGHPLCKCSLFKKKENEP